MPSNLRIVDYALGMTGSAHDASAFQSTAAALYPEWLFKDREFAWADSAYKVSRRVIPVHKAPENFNPRNRRFDYVVSSVRVRSEHAMGALKGRWQCLRGLRVLIRNNTEHAKACQWIQVAIVLHNIAIAQEGVAWADHNDRLYEEDVGMERDDAFFDVEDVEDADDLDETVGRQRRNELINELAELDLYHSQNA